MQIVMSQKQCLLVTVSVKGKFLDASKMKNKLQKVYGHVVFLKRFNDPIRVPKVKIRSLESEKLRGNAFTLFCFGSLEDYSDHLTFSSKKLVIFYSSIFSYRR